MSTNALRAGALHDGSPALDRRVPRAEVRAGGGLAMTVRIEPRDCWIGVFWDRRADGLHVYVCPVPCLVFHWVNP